LKIIISNIHNEVKRRKKSDQKEVIFKNHESIKNDEKWRKI
jgi:hypothetical protein